MSNLPNTLPDSVDHAIESLTQPLAVKVGKTFADLWYLVFDFISEKAEKRQIKRAITIEKFEQDTRSRVFEIPPDDLKEPNIQIAAQALEQSKYCIEEETLRKMFSELVASSMMKSREGVIHPSYATILAQMSNDDAMALLRFKDSPQLPVITINSSGADSGDGYSTLLTNVWENCEDLDSIDKSRACLESLSRLGLVDITYLEYIADDTLYSNLYTEHLQLLATQLSDIPSPKLSRKDGYAKLTQLGINFIACVCPQ